MANKKYQVFVSSTFKDLSVQRQMVIQHILDLHHIPAGMEMFPASDVNQLQYIKKIIDQCDYYVLIMANMYGSVADGISYTEQEYDYAVSTGKVVLAFPHSQPDTLPYEKSESDPAKREALLAFRQKVMDGRLVRQWATNEQLEVQVIKALSHAFNDLPQVGWVRADTQASADIISKNNELLLRNQQLQSEINEYNKNTLIDKNNLSDIDDTITIKLNTNRFDPLDFSSENKTFDIKMKWKELFLYLAPHIKGRSPDSVIKEALRKLIPSHYMDSEVIFTERQKTVIKSQLEALGLIINHAETNVSFETIELSPLGRTLMTNEMLIRKGGPSVI